MQEHPIKVNQMAATARTNRIHNIGRFSQIFGDIRDRLGHDSTQGGIETSYFTALDVDF